MSSVRTQIQVSDNALQVFQKRYTRTIIDKDGVERLETVAEVFERVAKALAEVERKYPREGKDMTKFVAELEEEFYAQLESFAFVPGGRTLANAGSGDKLVNNCIVLHIGDTMEDIFHTLLNAAILQKAGSGLGFPLHLMRYAGCPTKASSGVSSGPISFLHVYNTAFGVIKQQNRHGANMAMMRVDHPDILEFIACKKVEGSLKNFNVSVSLTDEFLSQVITKSTEPWYCSWQGQKMLPQRVVRGPDMAFLRAEPMKLTASEIFHKIAKRGWRNGEPGVAFIDAINRVNPLPGLGRIEASNPCGEVYLHDGDVCNLGSINLSKFVKNHDDLSKIDWKTTGNPNTDVLWDELKKTSRLALNMLDNVVDLTEHPVNKVNEAARNNRRIGLGIMGWADMLIMLRIGYDSEPARMLAEKVMSTITGEATSMSRALALQKGAFPNQHLSIYPVSEPIRNAAVTNIAPTGTTSMIADANGGLEPFFLLSYVKKNIMGGRVLQYTNKYLETALAAHGMLTESVLDSVLAGNGRVAHIASLPEIIRTTFVTSMDISVQGHVRMQAAFQKHLSNACSKTINLPRTATIDQVKETILLGWQLGCKGMTVYRDGSREKQVLEANSTPSTVPTTNASGRGTDSCPDCNTALLFQEGCWKCTKCGFGKCSI